MENALAERFGGRVRLRVCGVLVENDAILLVKHIDLGQAGFLWNPPGGGALFGESYEETLKREFLEETHLEIAPGRFLLFNEHIGNGIHAMELFFEVKRIGGELSLGFDPELSADQQLLKDLRFWSRKEIAVQPAFHFHKRLKEYF
jgi:8-oxo-dGTP diphosphatase